MALDPEYTGAHVELAEIYGQAYWRGIDTSEAFLAKYRGTIDRALELNPDSPSALRASANYHYRVENDYRKSLALLKQALESAPGEVDLHGDIGLSQRRLGRFQESIASFRKTLALDPSNRYYLALMVETMMAAGERPSVEAALCVGSISVSASTPPPSVSNGYRASWML